jgi:hypothetical protein
MIQVKSSPFGQQIWLLGPIFLRFTKILSQHHHFLSFLSRPFLPRENTFMDDYDEI